MKNRIWPSIMAKSQKELNQDLKNLQGAAKTVHLDIVDGKFAASKTLQFPFRLSKKFKYNAHLMVKNPEKWIDKYGSRVDFYIVHFEQINNVSDYIKRTKQKKKKVAFAILPETKIKDLKNYLQDIDYILILTVHPGFYGSRFLPRNLKKIAQVKKLNSKVKVIVDGGMSPKTIGRAVGADYFVSGSFITKAEKPKERIKMLMGKVEDY